MGDLSSGGGSNGNPVVAINIKDDDQDFPAAKNNNTDEVSAAACTFLTLPFVQKVIAESVGTYMLVFAGCASGIVNQDKGNVLTQPGMAIVWGLIVMVVVYSIGHISGAHINPAVTIAFATCKRFPWKEVPPYVAAQTLGATLASGTLRLLFTGNQDHFAGTLPGGSHLQSLFMEFIITFFLMFVISGVATDNRAIGELAGLAIGATILLNAMFAGPVSGASMNPARTLGPAMVWNNYRGIWIYLVGPTAGAIAGAWVYNIIRFTDKPLREITKSSSFLKSLSKNTTPTSN